jgi:hypothetical protein
MPDPELSPEFSRTFPRSGPFILFSARSALAIFPLRSRGPSLSTARVAVLAGKEHLVRQPPKNSRDRALKNGKLVHKTITKRYIEVFDH